MGNKTLPGAGRAISLEQTEDLWAYVHQEKLKWKDKWLLALFDWLLTAGKYSAETPQQQTVDWRTIKKQEDSDLKRDVILHTECSIKSLVKTDPPSI